MVLTGPEISSMITQFIIDNNNTTPKQVNSSFVSNGVMSTAESALIRIRMKYFMEHAPIQDVVNIALID
ncbi:unnamed protein product [Heterobilharzia americana]|nr:unnamed protein product [Heterobilharzia americana]